jgi:DNA-binding response OmpR family regulator
MSSDRLPNLRHVLVVDDEEIVLQSTERTLRRTGFRVVTAQSTAEALRRLEAEDAPRFLLIDWHMPGTDGLELVRQVRSRYGMDTHWLLLTTGAPGPDAAVEALRAGADDFIVKPWTFDELTARLEVGLRRIGAWRVGLKDVLQEAARGEGGEVVVRAGSVTGRVLVHGGSVAWVDLPGSEDTLFAVARERMQLGREEWDALLEDCRREKLNFFDALVQWNLATREVVRDCVREVVNRRLAALSGLRGATALFLPRARSGAPSMSFALEELSSLGLSTDEDQEPSSRRSYASVPPPGARREALIVVEALMKLDGASASAVIQGATSEVLAISDGEATTERNARAHARALQGLSDVAPAAELLSQSDGCWHLVMRTRSPADLFFYLAVREKGVPLAMARLRLRKSAEGYASTDPIDRG